MTGMPKTADLIAKRNERQNFEKFANDFKSQNLMDTFALFILFLMIIRFSKLIDYLGRVLN